MLTLRKSDLVAVRLPPGPAWLPLIDEILGAGAALLPLDVRLPDGELERILERAQPTVINDGTAARVDGREVDDDVAFVIATSGTAGTPALVEHTLAAARAAIAASDRRLGSTGSEAWLACLTPAHVGGLLVLLRAVLGSHPVEVHASFDPEAVSIADARWTSVVPVMLAQILATERSLDDRCFVVGGGPLAPSVAEEVRARGGSIVQTYGLTESFGGVVYDGVPLDGVEVRARGGEIHLRGPTMMHGTREGGTQRWTPDGWLRTRDAGEIVDGRWTIAGRLDEAIRTGGNTVWPQQVESVLGAHPSIAEVAVAGTPDESWGAIVTAFIVPRGSAPDLDNLRTFCGKALAPWQQPRKLVVQTSLPRTPSGKVIRRLLTT